MFTDTAARSYGAAISLFGTLIWITTDVINMP